MEVLLVLTIIAVLTTVGFVFQINEIEKHRYKQFIKTFQSDVLFVQQMTVMTEETYFLLIDEEREIYTIRKSGLSSTIMTREFPDGWDISLLTLSSPVSFSFKGNIKNPGTLLVKTGNSKFKIIFPLGKGRGYIVE